MSTTKEQTAARKRSNPSPMLSCGFKRLQHCSYPSELFNHKHKLPPLSVGFLTSNPKSILISLSKKKRLSMRQAINTMYIVENQSTGKNALWMALTAALRCSLLIRHEMLISDVLMISILTPS